LASQSRKLKCIHLVGQERLNRIERIAATKENYQLLSEGEDPVRKEREKPEDLDVL